MGAIKPQTLLSSQSFDKAKTAAGESEWGALGIFAVIYLSMATMMWILFFAFLQVGIKFLLRIVGLWFILISSPLAFVARTMKGTKHYFDQWLKMLVQFSLYPAIFMFMFLLLTKFAEAVLTVNTSGGGDFLGSIVNSLPTSNTSAAAASISISAAIASVAIRLGFIIALLYVSLRVSDWVVQQGSGLASAISGQMTGLPARGLAAGGGFFGRNTLGWAGTKVARSTSVRALAGGSSNLAFVGKGLRAAGKYTGSASFDVRGAGGVKAVLDKVGVAAGKGQKGGYIERSNASADVKEKAAKDLEPTAGEKEKAKEEAGHIAASKEKEQAKTVLDNGAARIKSLESAGKKGTPEFENAQRAQKVNQEAYSAADIKLKAVEARAKELSGEGLSKKFAQGTLLSRWAPTAGNPGWVTRSSREAATKLLKSKGAGEKEEHGDDHKPDGDGSGGGKGGGGAKGGSGGSSNSASGTSHAPTGGAGAHSSLSSLEQAMEKNTEVLKGIAKSVRQQANNSTYSFSASAPEINTAELGKVIGKTVVKGLENSDILRAPLPNIGPANENSSAPKAANDNNPVPRPPIQAANDNKPDASDSKAA
jgi:hypothetical protein